MLSLTKSFRFSVIQFLGLAGLCMYDEMNAFSNAWGNILDVGIIQIF